MKRTLITALAFVAVTTTAQADAVKAKECSIVATAALQLAQQNQAVSGLTDGCPQNLQVANADIARMVSPPRYYHPIAADLHKSLIQRGMPRALADQIAMSSAFQDWVNLRRATL